MDEVVVPVEALALVPEPRVNAVLRGYLPHQVGCWISLEDLPLVKTTFLRGKVDLGDLRKSSVGTGEERVEENVNDEEVVAFDVCDACLVVALAPRLLNEPHKAVVLYAVSTHEDVRCLPSTCLGGRCR